MATTDCTSSDSLEFEAFNDTNEPRIQQLKIGFASASQGIDTRAIDSYRQGVSIRTISHRFAGMQPKFNSGNPCHFTSVNTIGQSRDFVQYTESSIFKEIPRFNPVGYLVDPYYPLPLKFNGGGAEEEEAIIEPFIIPFRKDYHISNYYARGVHGSIESGNSIDVGYGKIGGDTVEQFIPYDQPEGSFHFLDEGQSYMGVPPSNETVAEEFNLSDLNPHAWFRADQGITAVTADQVSAWEDITGNVPDLAQSTVSKRPIVTVGTLGLPVVRFDGINDGLWTANQTLPTNYIMWIVAEVIAPRPLASTQLIFGANDSTILQNDWLAARTGDLQGEIGGSPNVVGTAALHSALSAFMLRADTYPTGEVRVDNVIAGSVTGGSDSSPVNGPLQIGSRLNNANPANIEVYEFAVFDADLVSEDDLTDLNDYYLKRYKDIYDRSIVLPTSYVIIEGFVDADNRLMSPFIDTEDEEIVSRLQTTDQDLISILKQGNVNLDEDLRETYTRRSATAGTSVYGPEANIYGTDSIAYNGWIRGA